MKLESIEISGYRSIGYPAKFYLGSRCIALVGVNESGKSNFLQAISELRFFQSMGEDAFSYRKAHHTCAVDSSAKVLIQFSKEELQEAGLSGDDEADANVNFVFGRDKTSAFRMSFDGIFQRLLQADKELCTTAAEFKSIFDRVVELNSNYKNNGDFIRCKEMLATYDCMYWGEVSDIAKWAKNNLSNHFEEKERKAQYKTYDDFVRLLSHWYVKLRSVSPVVCFYDDTQTLDDVYTLDDLRQQGQRPKNLTALKRLLAAIGFNVNDVISALEFNDGSKRGSLQTRIQRKIRNLMDAFNNSYATEKIELDMQFERNAVSFHVISGEEGDSVYLSERSVGLRWILNAFIEINRATKYKNVIILVDEPAAHLHVDAQKDILQLFDKLVENGRWLIYTTHSPYMINQNKLGNVRAVIKTDGSSSICELSQLQSKNGLPDAALSPICDALGFDLRYNIGPTFDRLNVLVEGITEYYYLEAMCCSCGLPDSVIPNILPCGGAGKIGSVLSILVGWGCKYCLLFDNDKAGRDAVKSLKKELGDLVEGKMFFVTDGEQDGSIESLIVTSDIQAVKELNHYDASTPVGKKIIAKAFHIMVTGGRFTPSEATRKNFYDLFVKLGIVGGDGYK